MDTTTERRQNTAKRASRIAVALGALVLLAGAGIWWFLRDDAPAEVSIAAAVEATEADVETSVGDGSTATDESSDNGDDISGSWTVDTDTGEFDYESASGSFVGFRIEEELTGVGSTTAVGRTGDITGTVDIEGTSVTAASFEIDMTTITTDDSRRDDNAQDALETGSFPTAAFVLTEPIELGADAASGETVSVPAVGDLTIHGVTQSVTFNLDAQQTGSTVVVVGSTELTFSDFGVEVPNGGPVISVDDFGVLELQLLLVR